MPHDNVQDWIDDWSNTLLVEVEKYLGPWNCSKDQWFQAKGVVQEVLRRIHFGEMTATHEEDLSPLHQ